MAIEAPARPQVQSITGEWRDPLPNDHVIAQMSEKGDTKHIWNPDNAAEVAAAKALFDSLTKSGHMAYKVVGEDGKKGEQMRTFDPQAGKVILAPAMKGG